MNDLKVRLARPSDAQNILSFYDKPGPQLNRAIIDAPIREGVAAVALDSDGKVIAHFSATVDSKGMRAKLNHVDIDAAKKHSFSPSDLRHELILTIRKSKGLA